MTATAAATKTMSTIMPSARYRNAHAAIDWLCEVLGFTRHQVFANPDGTIAHAELVMGNGMFMLSSEKDDEYGRNFASPGSLGKETRSVYILVADADEVYARAQRAKAEITRPIEDTHYGSREFGVKDPEGYSWSVGTYDPWQAHP